MPTTHVLYCCRCIPVSLRAFIFVRDTFWAGPCWCEFNSVDIFRWFCIVQTVCRPEWQSLVNTSWTFWRRNPTAAFTPSTDHMTTRSLATSGVRTMLLFAPITSCHSPSTTADWPCLSSLLRVSTHLTPSSTPTRCRYLLPLHTLTT